MHPPYVRFSLLTLAITANSYALAESSEPETLQLKETVVTASGFEQQVKNAPVSSTGQCNILYWSTNWILTNGNDEGARAFSFAKTRALA